MKKIILAIYFIGFSAFLFAQDGAEQIITKKIGVDKVEINIGEQFEIKVDDVFQVFGKGQIIHPATGKLVERDNVYLGKIKVLEVKELTSIAEISEEKKDFAVGNKLVKVVSEDQQIVENKQPIQSEFENPEKRNYSETIYTQKEKKVKPKKNVHIIEIKEENNQIIAIIDKGNETKAKGGKPRVGKEYYVYVPIIDTSSITGQQHIEGEEYIGIVKINTMEHDASTGSLDLHINHDYSFIKEQSVLRTYLPKNKGWHHLIRMNIISIGANFPEEQFSIFNGLELINGYRFTPYFFTGLGLGYNTEYHSPYIDAKMNNLPVFAHFKFNIFNRKNSLSINTSIGKNVVLNSTHDIRPYNMYGKLYFAGGIGLKTYTKNFGAITIDLESEYKHFDIQYDYDSNWLQSNYLLFIKLKLGFELNYSPIK